MTLITFGGKTLTFAGREPERTVVDLEALKPDLSLLGVFAASAAKPTHLASADKTGPATMLRAL